MTEFIYVRRLADGVILDIPAKHYEQTMKSKQFEFVSKIHVDVSRRPTNVPIIADTIEAEVKSETSISCPLCGFIPRNEHSLKIHKARMHG